MTSSVLPASNVATAFMMRRRNSAATPVFLKAASPARSRHRPAAAMARIVDRAPVPATRAVARGRVRDKEVGLQAVVRGRDRARVRHAAVNPIPCKLRLDFLAPASRDAIMVPAAVVRADKGGRAARAAGTKAATAAPTARKVCHGGVRAAEIRLVAGAALDQVDLDRQSICPG